MVSLKLQKRLAASVLKCGKNKVWIDPATISDVAGSTSRSSVRRLIKDKHIRRLANKGQSRERFRRRLEAKRAGRHRGLGKRRGTREARLPSKTIWIRRQRVLRRLLSRYRDAGKIDHHLYHELYLLAKGNTFKNKRVLVEHIHHAQNEVKRLALLEEQNEARRAKNRVRRERNAARMAARLTAKL